MVRASKKKKGLLFRDVIEEKQQKEKEEEGFFSLSFNISCCVFSPEVLGSRSTDYGLIIHRRVHIALATC
jgi:hypothetical protein